MLTLFSLRSCERERVERRQYMPWSEGPCPLSMRPKRWAVLAIGLALSVSFATGAEATRYDVVIVNGMVYDGTGATPNRRK